SYLLPIRRHPSRNLNCAADYPRDKPNPSFWYSRASQAQRASPRETEDSAADRLKTFPPARREHGLPRTPQSLRRQILCRFPAQAGLPVEVVGVSARSGQSQVFSDTYTDRKSTRLNLQSLTNLVC